MLAINATTSGRYDSDENKELHVGDTRSISSRATIPTTPARAALPPWTATPITVELTAGEFDKDDQVKIYRDEKMGSKTCIGSGTLVRGLDVAVQRQRPRSEKLLPSGPAGEEGPAAL